jgi:multidrug resistance efflux pump
MSRTRTLITSASVAAAALLLSGCGMAQQAIDQGQAAVDDAQSLVDSATAITNAPEAISTACRTALEGTVPGTPIEEAQAALTTATAEVDAALGLAGTLPVVSDLRDTMVNAAESLLTDGSAASLASARDSIVGMCDLVK